ncbi:S8 family peptidase [Sulfurovum sp.]|uniref:S8 family peptidase n=1 Tax=Sulfurovum sp. TaxID=1969726 RepID=UPI0025D0573A|nr:S8 family peptidase [Sulfurovum sp.]
MKKTTVSVGVCFALAMCGGMPLYAAPASMKAPNIQSVKSSQPAWNIGTDKNGNEYVKGEVIVKYKNQVNLNRVSSVIGSANVSKIKEFKTLSNTLKKTLIQIHSDTFSTEELIQEYQNDPDVEYVEPNYIRHPSKIPNDPKFNLLWGQHNTGQTVNGTSGTPGKDMKAPEAWNKTTGSKSIVIAVIDTGVDYLHEDLAANMWVNTKEIPGNGIDDDHNGYVDDVHGINAIDDSGDPMDVVLQHGGHGTHVAGTIAAVGNNGIGVVGVSWNAKIMALKFLGPQGGKDSDSIKCMEYMIAEKDRGVNIVASNNSWGGPGASQAVKDTIAATVNKGILFMAAAGNDGSDNDSKPSYPASYDLSGIVAVAATDQNDELASFSNYGRTSVDLAAPGVNIYSTVPREYQPKTGDISFDDIEGPITPGWGFDGTHNSWGATDNGEIFDQAGFPPPPSPTHFLSDSPGANYLPGVEEYAYKCVDLSNAPKHTYFAFSAAHYIQATDHGYVLLTGDSGNSVNLVEDFGGGTAPDVWHYNYTVEIPDSLKTSGFCFIFDLISDANSKGAPGMLFDNIGIGTKLTSAYGFKDGTSMATPQVTGAAALIASICGKETPLQLKQRILSTVDPVASLNGKMTTGGRLNVNNAISNCGQKPSYVPLVPVYYLLGM